MPLYSRKQLMPRRYPSDKTILEETGGHHEWWCYDIEGERITDWWWTEESRKFESVDSRVKFYIGIPVDTLSSFESNMIKPVRPRDETPHKDGDYWCWCPDFEGAMVLNWPDNEVLIMEYATWYVPYPIPELE